MIGWILGWDGLCEIFPAVVFAKYWILWLIEGWGSRKLWCFRGSSRARDWVAWFHVEVVADAVMSTWGGGKGGVEGEFGFQMYCG